MFNRVPGTKDILPGQSEQWQNLERISDKTFSCFNYRHIRTPIIEHAALFSRTLGEATEIVQKQMFLIKKDDEDVYALRPEATASICRAFIENNLDKTQGFVKVWYAGPMFRMERPQKGRLRQFHHIGAEAIGSASPEVDVEIIDLARTLLDNFKISGFTIVINSLGCGQDRKAFSQKLRERLKDKLGSLCEECVARYERNVLRILDCKNERCSAIAEDLVRGHDHLCPDCSAHFNSVKRGLDSLAIPYQVSPRLVRGLDYYTRTVFEFKHSELGSQQDALGAGGRYDGLVQELGGPQTPAIGFAFGVERLLLCQEAAEIKPSPLVFCIPLGDAAVEAVRELVHGLRGQGIRCDGSYESRSLKGAMRRANDLGASTVLILGDNELAAGTVTLKDMASGAQENVSRKDLTARLKVLLSEAQQ